MDLAHYFVGPTLCNSDDDKLGVIQHHQYQYQYQDDFIFVLVDKIICI
jgi:hypothetical protein